MNGHFALYVNPVDESTTAGEITAVYDNLRKLYAATWLIYQRETNEIPFKNEPTAKSIAEIADEIFEIRGIGPAPTVGETSALNAIKNLP